MSSYIFHIKIKSNRQGTKTLNSVESTDLSYANFTIELLWGKSHPFNYASFKY